MRITYLLGCLFLFCFSCNESALNQKSIMVKGCVTDSLTNMAISNAKVTLLCWYHAGWDKTDYVSIDTIADKNGCFAATFEEGYKVIVAGVAPDFAPVLKETSCIDSSDIEINLMLKKATNENWNIDLRRFIVEHSNSD